MWNTRDTPPQPERIGWVATPKYHDLGHHATLGFATTSAILKLLAANSQDTADAREQTLWPRTQTLAAVLLLIERSQRLKKTETPPKETTKGPRPGPDHLPEEPAFETFQRGVTCLGPRPEPDLLPEEHSESATRSLLLRGQRRTQDLLVSDMWDTL